MWIESLRLVPDVPRERRIAFCNGIGSAMVAISMISTVAGYALAARLPVLLSAAVLFLTPLSFLLSTSRNARMLVDRLALIFGLGLTPLFAWAEIELHLLLAALTAGTLAYGFTVYGGPLNDGGGCGGIFSFRRPGLWRRTIACAAPL